MLMIKYTSLPSVSLLSISDLCLVMTFNFICQAVVIDEAHRMKSTTAATRAVVQAMDKQWMLLLTGMA